MAVHLNQYHLVPLARTASLMQDLYGAPLSQASIQTLPRKPLLSCAPRWRPSGKRYKVQASSMRMRPAYVSKAHCTGCTAPSPRH